MARLTRSILTLGSDPEFLLKNNAGNSVPAYGLFGGTKKEPLSFHCTPTEFVGSRKEALLNSKQDNAWYLEDGAALELNIPIARDIYSLVDNLVYWRNRAETNLLRAKSLSIHPASCATFTDKDFENPLSKVIGCEPDYDAYNGGLARQPFVVEQFGNKRFAGFHIHVGLTPWPEELPKHIFVQFLDLFLGSMMQHVDFQPERKPFYGLPGLFRPTPYGVEYRSLSIAAWDQFVTNTKPLTNMFTGFLNYCTQISGPRGEVYLDMLSEFYLSGKIDWLLVKDLLSKNSLKDSERRTMAKFVNEACRRTGILSNYG